MRTVDLNFEVDELDKLCHLYIDSKLSVLEEKELEYILLHTTLTSQAIEDVKSIMALQIAKPFINTPLKRKWNWRLFSIVAANVAVVLIFGVIYFINNYDSSLSKSNNHVYIMAYSHGQRLNGEKAVAATDIAIAKANSLMRYASLAERDYLKKANDIISATTDN